MKTSEFPSVVAAKKAATAQLGFYKSMMQEGRPTQAPQKPAPPTPQDKQKK
jgi:hypothetical protein